MAVVPEAAPEVQALEIAAGEILRPSDQRRQFAQEQLDAGRGVAGAVLEPGDQGLRDGVVQKGGLDRRGAPVRLGNQGVEAGQNPLLLGYRSVGRDFVVVEVEVGVIFRADELLGDDLAQVDDHVDGHFADVGLAQAEGPQHSSNEAAASVIENLGIICNLLYSGLRLISPPRAS